MTAPMTVLADPDAPRTAPRRPVMRSRDHTVVQTRFGTVVVDRDNILEMPLGPLGFAQHREFALADLPNPRLAAFKLLQSLSDPEVCFVLAPAAQTEAMIAPSDIDAACAAAGFDPAETTVWLIVTVRSTADGVAMSVNLRAPLLLDLPRRTARQVVLANPIYSVRHPI